MSGLRAGGKGACDQVVERMEWENTERLLEKGGIAGSGKKNNSTWQKSKIQCKMSKKQDTTSFSSRGITHVSDSDSI